MLSFKIISISTISLLLFLGINSSVLAQQRDPAPTTTTFPTQWEEIIQWQNEHELPYYTQSYSYISPEDYPLHDTIAAESDEHVLIWSNGGNSCPAGVFHLASKSVQTVGQINAGSCSEGLEYSFSDDGFNLTFTDEGKITAKYPLGKTFGEYPKADLALINEWANSYADERFHLNTSYFEEVSLEEVFITENNQIALISLFGGRKNCIHQQEILVNKIEKSWRVVELPCMTIIQLLDDAVVATDDDGEIVAHYPYAPSKGL